MADIEKYCGDYLIHGPKAYDKIAVCTTIKTAPTIDPYIHAHWIETSGYVDAAYRTLRIYQCSHCDAEITIDEHDSYCPCCGANMDGGKQ